MQVVEIVDEETLFRGIPDDERYFPIGEDGIRRISHMAFNDRERRPSIDIASLCGDSPEYTAKMRGPNVLSLHAGTVRQISATREVPLEQGSAVVLYHADVCHEPTEENIAHGVIFGKPPFDTGSLFERVKRALAREARWAIEPSQREDKT
jgi:hypothetical protein